MPVLERNLSQPVDTSGYCSVSLHKQGKRQTFRVHVLVALAFLGERPKSADINHINGDKSDNRLINLEYCNRSRNVQHAYDHDLIPKGNKHYRAKLDREKVRSIREMSTYGISSYKLGKRFNVTTATILDVIRLKTWKE
jgi:hypothetical protein